MRPVITMSSDPSLPESEILSRLLFGLSPGQLTPIQSARLAATLAGLAGGSGFDVLGRLENVLLLDTLDFAESSDGTAIITTGKYIRPNVYVEAQNSLDGDVGVAIDWEPFSNLTVRGETSSDTGQELSVRWRRDFDRIKKQGPDNGD
jgi:translocation and assembly module TamB